MTMHEQSAEFAVEQFSEVYLPDYSGNSIYNLINSVLRRFGLNRSGVLTGFNDVLGHNKVVVFLVDGLGYSHMVSARPRISSLDSFLKKASHTRQITTVFPSTTSTVLSTVNTAMTPAEHGIVGFTMYVKELGSVVNTITFSPASEKGDGAFERSGLQPSFMYPQKTVFQELVQLGVHSRVLTPNYLANTVLSKTLYNGAERIKYVQLSDLFVGLRKALSQTRYDQEYFFVYWSGVDTVSHKYGPGTEEYDAELNGFFHLFESELLDKLNGSDVSILVTADHGHTYIPDGSFHDLSGDSDFLSSLMVPPTGDSRAFFLYPSDREKMERMAQSRFGDTSVLVDSEEALKRGFFGLGDNSSVLKSRIGEKIVLPYKPHSYVYRYPTFEYKPMFGNHGGLTLEELIIPLVAFEL
jgi:hypothetical protein